MAFDLANELIRVGMPPEQAKRIMDAIAAAGASAEVNKDAAEAANEAAQEAALAALGVGVPVAVWDSGTTRRMIDRARDTYCILDAPGGADPTGANDSTAALQAMVAEANASGVKMELTKGDFVLSEALSLERTGQVLQGQGMGYGYGSAATALRDFVPESRIIATGTFARRLLTRRAARLTAADPDDPVMSAAIEVNADHVNLRDFAVWLDCDYTDLDPSNLGADVDVGIFVGCRPGVQMSNVGVFGYFRKAGLYIDVTRDPLQLPELLGPDGNPLPSGASGASFRGVDGIQLWNPYIRGARVALAVLGAKNTGGDYYDTRLGAVVPDRRGASGSSDFNVYGGRLYAGGHHSGRRLVDPIGYGSALTRANMEAEGDFAPAGIHIDGWSANGGNTTHGQGALRGFNFFATRVADPEIFRVRLGRCDEVAFTGRAWIENGTNGVTVQDASGVDVNTNDYVNSTYGHFSTTSATGAIRGEAVSGGVWPRWASPSTRLMISQANGLAREVGADSGQVELADDAVASITPPVLGGWLRITRSPTGGPIYNQSALVWFDVGSSPDVQPVSVGASVTLATTDLTDGTADGVDGNFCVSARDGVIKLKNRTGSASLWRYRWI